MKRKQPAPVFGTEPGMTSPVTHSILTGEPRSPEAAMIRYIINFATPLDPHGKLAENYAALVGGEIVWSELLCGGKRRQVWIHAPEDRAALAGLDALLAADQAVTGWGFQFP